MTSTLNKRTGKPGVLLAIAVLSISTGAVITVVSAVWFVIRALIDLAWLFGSLVGNAIDPPGWREVVVLMALLGALGAGIALMVLGAPSCHRALAGQSRRETNHQSLRQ
ncbi:MAG: hypothetical protein GY716_06755 [bacterium]|nr:hypothetical protein [bacterium]